ncbi:tetratricopeptide repeat protein [Candidatus Desantisbacteria bacterium]|nr:tetratricopeptide repeat protein [Candidatus Desantisbacteria bacterium]
MVKLRLLLPVVFLGILMSSFVAAEEEKTIEELQAENNLLQVKIKTANDQKSTLTKKYNDCVEERDKNAEKIKQLTATIAQKEDEKTQIQADVNKKTDEIQKKLNSAEDEIANMQAQLKEKIQTIKDKTAEIGTLSVGLSSEKAQSATWQKDFQTQQANLQKEIDGLKATLKEKENTIVRVEGQLTTIENQLKETSATLEKYRADEAQTAALKETLNKEKKDLEQSSIETHKKKEEALALNNQLTERLNQLMKGIVPEEIKKEQGQKQLDYVKRLYSMKLKETNAYTIMELERYIASYLGLEKSDEIQYIVGQLYEDEKKYNEAAVIYAKLICIWTEGTFVSKAKGKIRDMEKARKIDKEFSQKLLSLSCEGGKKEEKWFNYIKQISMIVDASLYPYLDHELDEFLRCYPIVFEAYQVKVQNLLRMKNSEYLAIAAYVKTIQLYPNQPQIAQIYFETGKIFDNVKDYQNAISFYQEGISKFPNDSNSPAYLLEIARIFTDKLKDDNKAIKAYESIVAAYPKSEQAPVALFESGKIFEGLKRYEQVIETYGKMVKEYPQSLNAPSALIAMGNCYEKISDYEQAVTTYQRLYREYPKNSCVPETLYRAGQLCEENLNNNEKAIEIYQLILKNFSEDSYAKKADSRVKKLAK